jgi:hypothetical protein
MPGYVLVFTDEQAELIRLLSRVSGYAAPNEWMKAWVLQMLDAMSDITTRSRATQEQLRQAQLLAAAKFLGDIDKLVKETKPKLSHPTEKMTP